jgi:uncharacterized protein (DUF58 family)
VTRYAAPKLGTYTALVALGLVAALVSGRAELVAVVVPLACALLAGLVAARRPEVDVALAVVGEPRLVEGQDVAVELRLSARSAVEQLEVLLTVPAGLAAADGDALVALGLAAGEQASRTVRLRGERWGLYRLGEVHLRARDRWGLFQYEARAEDRVELRVYPDAAALARLVPPAATRASVGNQVAGAKGDGIEFADVRPFQPGDRVRRVNWRASARRAELWVNEAHPERNTDVVLFLDTFAEAASSAGGTLEEAARAAVALAARYLARRDRVGLVRVGGALHWLEPGGGPSQLQRVAEALLEAAAWDSAADRGLAAIPPRTLPPHSLVLALTPLLDPRGRAILADLHAHGHDLVVVEVSPLPFVQPTRDAFGAAALTLWRLERQVRRAALQRLGVAVAEWRPGAALDPVLEEVTAFRRAARPGRAPTIHVVASARTAAAAASPGSSIGGGRVPNAPAGTAGMPSAPVTTRSAVRARPVRRLRPARPCPRGVLALAGRPR